MNESFHFLYYAAVVAVLVHTLTHEEIFKEPRQWLKMCADSQDLNACLRKLAYMPTCEFCGSFWITLGLLTLVFQYHLIFADWRGYVVSVFTTMGVANVYMGLFNLLRVDVRKERALADVVERRKSA